MQGDPIVSELHPNVLSSLDGSSVAAIGALYCDGRATHQLGDARAPVFATIVPLSSVIIAAGVIHQSPGLFELPGAARRRGSFNV